MGRAKQLTITKGVKRMIYLKKCAYALLLALLVAVFGSGYLLA